LVRARTLLAILLVTLPIQNVAAAAAPQQFDCVLTDTGNRLAAENRPIVVIFDEDKKTLQAQAGGQTYGFSQVSISTVSISGQSGNVSLGIDRSSLGIVWQQYGPEQPVIEFGHCSPPGSGAHQ
jgi:hypothetical protein